MWMFFFGWIGNNDGSALNDCLSIYPSLRGSNTIYHKYAEQIFSTSESIKKMGAVRYIGASFHTLNLAQQWFYSPLLDVVMVRHNTAHRLNQTNVFIPSNNIT